MTCEKQNVEAADSIAGDRRENRRYGIRLDVKWKLIRRRRVLDAGSGNTVDLSSGGLLIDAGRHLPEGLDMEVAIAWPVMLRNVAPLQLVVSGRIVRAKGPHVAVRTVQHEFRTVGFPADHRNVLTAMSAAPILAGPSIFASLAKLQ